MKLWGLIDFSLILIMTCYSKGSDDKIWAINVNRSINAQYGSNVIIPYPVGTTVPTFETTTVTALKTSKHIYIAIFVPIIALLIIILVIGIVCFMKHKRSKTFTREESGYYANFSRAFSSEAKREISCQTHDNKKLPEPKVIHEPTYLKATEDPVYLNLESSVMCSPLTANGQQTYQRGFLPCRVIPCTYTEITLSSVTFMITCLPPLIWQPAASISVCGGE
ncbi:hypothetical protein L3Q82_013129 [Scortum barcoo]|uniref:Uncharacterized protein n=1 Tax=Scortum barcoo TaxID=214431 RepID=A0ACB8VZS4_9TELE|nr:hypothetical protein L3Q82_013129 [Scortum barcoo]